MKQSPDCEKIKLLRKNQNRENQGTIKQNQSTDEECYIEHICDLKNKTICKKNALDSLVTLQCEFPYSHFSQCNT